MTTIKTDVYIHQSGDRILNLLAGLDGIIGEYIKYYPGKTQDPSSNWLDSWFRQRVEKLLNVEEDVIESEKIDILLGDVAQLGDPIISRPVKIKSLYPQYFRGFRKLSQPITFLGSLIVFEGRNSTGKTSLSEALEWLLTGQLIRRQIQQYGDARELEDCITNQLRPDGENTWVEAVFVTNEGEEITVKRVLKRDYGTTQTSKADSVLYFNGTELNIKEEIELLDNLFAGIPPILMQHSLRLFVLSSPTERRNYFEKLLRMDELTYLIEKTVVGDSRFLDFPSSTGSLAFTVWEKLRGLVKQNSSKNIFRNVTKSEGDLANNLVNALLQVAKLEFPEVCIPELSIEQVTQILRESQKKSRELSFPLLEALRPSRVIDDQLIKQYSSNEISDLFSTIVSSFEVLEKIETAAKDIGIAQIIIAEAFDKLRSAKVIFETDEPQICALCNFTEIPTLTSARVKEINSWIPTQKIAKEAQLDYQNAISNFSDKLSGIVNTINSLLPKCPEEDLWNLELEKSSENVKVDACQCYLTLSDAKTSIKPLIDSCNILQEILNGEDRLSIRPSDIESYITTIKSQLPNVIEMGKVYSIRFENLEKTIGSQAKEDPNYNLKEVWLNVKENLETTQSDLLWEKAKFKAQKELEQIREKLIIARQKLLQTRRDDFNMNITSIWQNLRSDTSSLFSRLYIPEPRGRGFPIEIEVKASLTDGTQTKEVDALRIFSESQVNVIGIAAFITRSKLVGHQMIVFDDPVQSMDEEHFKTFSTKVIPELLGNGFQVVIFTHNDAFAREISLAHFESTSYTTMRIRHSKKIGCQVEDGNRRVAERLKNAEKLGEEGNFDQAWVYVRLAIERLYVITYKKHGPSTFNPISWIDQTAESMWNSGIGDIIEGKKPGISPRLKEILNMSVAGAHDISAKGNTDLINAIRDLRSLLPLLNLGDG